MLPICFLCLVFEGEAILDTTYVGMCIPTYTHTSGSGRIENNWLEKYTDMCG